MLGTVQIGGRAVGISGDSLSVPQALNHFYFDKWLHNFDHGRMRIDHINIQSADFFNDRVIFIKFEVLAFCTRTGKRLPGIVCMRGDSVQISVRVRNKDTGQLFYLLVQQPRIPIGRYDMIEIPAGVFDPDGETLVSRALAELGEETGVVVSAEALKLDGSFVTSTGGSDEVIHCFSVDVELGTEAIEKLCAQIHGVAKEGEMIKVFLVTPEEYVQMILRGELTDSKALIAALLRTLKFNPALVVQALAHS